MHLAQEGNRLREGDIIHLNLFTPLTYSPSGKAYCLRMPSVLIHTHSLAGYLPLPKNADLHNPMQCEEVSTDEIDNYNNHMDEVTAGTEVTTRDGLEGGWERLEEVECTTERKYCSVYGLSNVFANLIQWRR